MKLNIIEYKYTCDELMNTFIITYAALVTRAMCFPKAAVQDGGQWKYSNKFFNYLSKNCPLNPIGRN